MPIRGYVCDAYGTLFDVHSVVEAGRDITTDPLAPSLLWRQKQSSGLDGYFAHVLSVDAVRVVKPSPRVYGLGTAALTIPATELLFVSSNAWDVTGAAAFGYRVAWCNRTGAPDEELGVRADFVVTGLEQLPAEG